MLASGSNLDLVKDLGLSSIELVRRLANGHNLDLITDLKSPGIWD